MNSLFILYIIVLKFLIKNKKQTTKCNLFFLKQNVLFSRLLGIFQMTQDNHFKGVILMFVMGGNIRGIYYGFENLLGETFFKRKEKLLTHVEHFALYLYITKKRYSFLVPLKKFLFIFLVYITTLL